MQGRTQPRTPGVTNVRIADALAEVARLLEHQGANQRRVQTYRAAAAAVRAQPALMSDILREEGVEGLDRLPGIELAIARAIRQMVETGRLAMLERLRGENEPVPLLATVPGVGLTFARRLHDELGIDTLEQLNVAAHDGRMETMKGFGPKRVAGIRAALAERLTHGRFPHTTDHAAPSVAELLDVDREYRDGAARGTLRTIAPRRFNPSGDAWLPVLHTERGGRHYTALFSNTALAHRLGRTHDWVALYDDGDDGDAQVTVVTAHGGELDGRRVVRGREDECRSHYAQADGTGSGPG